MLEDRDYFRQLMKDYHALPYSPFFYLFFYLVLSMILLIPYIDNRKLGCAYMSYVIYIYAICIYIDIDIGQTQESIMYRKRTDYYRN